MNDELKNSLIKFIIVNSSFLIFFSSCSVQRQIARSANEDVLDAAPLQTAHVGISIYEPATNKYWYDYQGDKYFTPASNTKIATCYAAMKYLGDSLVSCKYTINQKIYLGDSLKYNKYPVTNQKIAIYPNGDPTFLLFEFHNQPLLDFLNKNKSDITICLQGWQDEPLGSGWSWGDYQESYMAERSVMPIYGNVVNFSGELSQLRIIPRHVLDTLEIHSEGKISYIKDIERSRVGNRFIVQGEEGSRPNTLYKTFDTKNGKIIAKLLSDTLKCNVDTYGQSLIPFNRSTLPVLKSQPTDSVLKPMMHRSDNFFAEQFLLMVSNERLGFMNDEKIIDTILKTDLKDLPQMPRWVDGSGLSRYNLFSPQGLVFILNKMKNEFGMERVKAVFPTGGKGTLANYYIPDSSYLYAKTGTLSGVVALSGYLYTKKGKELIFSVLVNNHQASGTEVRRAVEKFLQRVRNKY